MKKGNAGRHVEKKQGGELEHFGTPWGNRRGGIGRGGPGSNTAWISL